MLAEDLLEAKDLLDLFEAEDLLEVEDRSSRSASLAQTLKRTGSM